MSKGLKRHTTARKLTGGKAPYHQVAAKAARKSAPSVPQPGLSDSEGERRMLKRYIELDSSAEQVPSHDTGLNGAASSDAAPPAEVINDLQGQVRELLDFIDTHGPTLST